MKQQIQKSINANSNTFKIKNSNIIVFLKKHKILVNNKLYDTIKIISWKILNGNLKHLDSVFTCLEQNYNVYISIPYSFDSKVFDIAKRRGYSFNYDSYDFIQTWYIRDENFKWNTSQNDKAFERARIVF